MNNEIVKIMELKQIHALLNEIHDDVKVKKPASALMRLYRVRELLEDFKDDYKDVKNVYDSIELLIEGIKDFWPNVKTREYSLELLASMILHSSRWVEVRAA